MVNWIEDIYCCEFSNTYAVPGTMQVNRQTRFHKGSVAGSSPEGGVHYFHTSFRAFRGASGAPVFVHRSKALYVLGMILGEGQSETFLLQRETERDGQKVLEQSWYALPTARAISATSLAVALSDMEVDYEMIETVPDIAAYKFNQVKPT